MGISHWKTALRRMSSTVSTKVTQPKWHQPGNSTNEPVLKLLNTLTRNKDVFIPQSGGKRVTWYSCGPTVYDASHMGHARNYVSIDINRRIMQDYFGYDISFVQNVTDIDDKIIIRARQTYLFKKFLQEQNASEKEESVTQFPDESILKSLNEYLLTFIESNLKIKATSIQDYEKWATINKPNIETLKIESPKLPMYITSIDNAVKALSSPKNTVEFFQQVKDILVPALDSQFGSEINDPKVFQALPQHWEHEYDKDMRTLNVLPPDITTRVSEYVPEIVDFVKKIIDNGYAYPTSDGSVYFDTAKFDSSNKHDYAKCQPWNKGKLDLIQDGEGSLSNSVQDTKKSANDFALWKSSKPGEPKWSSPWGEGRPGWHIECSVMASDIHGATMDIHSGGIDLAFPHHDNELAQSEAHYDNCQWVNYFLHTGHLHIEGQKMSKSLKNFITIDEALSKYTWRQMRLCFALVQWNNQLDFKESLIQEAKGLESSFNNFFKNTRALNNDFKHAVANGVYVSKKTGNLEKKLLTDLYAVQDAVHVAFCDNLSTPVAIKNLAELVTKTNTYISTVGSDLKIEYVLNNVKYVTKILNTLGFTARPDGLGWEDVAEVSNKRPASLSNTASAEDTVLPYVKALSTFRDQVRQYAISKAPYGDFLILSDKVRDDDLLKLNVSLDDRSDNQGALVKFLNDQEREELLQQVNERELKKREKEQKKLEQARLRELKERERKEKASLKPQDMFKNTELYSAWDENGMPTKDKDGNEVTKSMTKKLKKQWDAQKKLHDEFFG